MKICHCIKLSEQEKTAIKTVQGIFREMAQDDMIFIDFQHQKDGNLDDIGSWFDDVADYLESFGE